MNDPVTQIHISIPSDLHWRVKQEAVERKISMKELVKCALEKELDGNPRYVPGEENLSKEDGVV